MYNLNNLIIVVSCTTSNGFRPKNNKHLWYSFLHNTLDSFLDSFFWPMIYIINFNVHFYFLSKNNISQQKLTKWFETMFNQRLITHFPLLLLFFLHIMIIASKKEHKITRNVFLLFEFLEASSLETN